MRCLFLGASGYLGRHLVAALLAEGHEVTTRLPAHGADPARLDITDSRSLVGVDWSVDRVFLFAGVTGTAASFQHFETYVRGNEISLLNVLEAIRQSPHRPRVVFPSSRLVYKGADHALAETAPLEAKTVYAANKIACEHYLRAYSSAFGIPHTIFRICVPYGNSRDDQYSFGTIGNFIGQATKTGTIRLYGDGSVRRTFTHVDDLCRLMVMGVAPSICANETFNIPGEDLSLREAAGCIAERLNATIETVDWPALDWRIESGSTVFDGSCLQDRLKASPMHTLAAWAANIAPRLRV